MKSNEREFLEKRALELQAQLSKLPFTEHTILERGKLRGRLCHELIDVERMLVELGGTISAVPPMEEAVASRPRKFERLIGGRRLQLLEAIERALAEADNPLDADDIAYIIVSNKWVRDSRRSSREGVQGAITRSISNGNKLNIVALNDGKTCRYWLGRKNLAGRR